MGFGRSPPKKWPEREGHLKKIREEGRSRKILPLLEGGRGKKISCLGGSCSFLMTLQKIPPAPPYLVKNERSLKRANFPFFLFLCGYEFLNMGLYFPLCFRNRLLS